MLYNKDMKKASGLSLFLFIALLFIGLVFAGAVRAVDPSSSIDTSIGNTPLIVPFGDTGQSVPSVEAYINSLYKWGIGIAALFAVLFIAIGAIQKTLSAGNIGSTQEASGKIKRAIGGLILLILAATLLVTINPRLGNLGLVRPEPPAAPPPVETLEQRRQREATALKKEVEETIWTSEKFNSDYPYTQHELSTILNDFRNQDTTGYSEAQLRRVIENMQSLVYSAVDAEIRYKSSIVLKSFLYEVLPSYSPTARDFRDLTQNISPIFLPAGYGVGFR